MPRYIDVAKQLVRLYRMNLDCEDVIKEFLVTAVPEEVVDKERYDRLLENATIISEALNKYQSADMVEVVRCKDCKHSHKITDANVITLLSCNYQNAHGMLVENHGYCKWGKRKETEDETSD